MVQFDERLVVVTAQLEKGVLWGGERRGMQGREGKGIKERREGRGEWSGSAPASLQPCSGLSLLPALDQDSLECEAWISIWGIGRNV